MRIILLGAPGSGKGTQAVKISEKYGIPHVSTGDIFRDNISKKTELGLKVKALMDGGHFCPDDMTVELVKNRLNNHDCEKGYLLDGFPRNLFQANELEKFSSPAVVINLMVDLSKIEKRITGRRVCSNCGESYHVDFIGDTVKCSSCGGDLIVRKDDTVETVKERLSVYKEQTEPLVDFYTKNGKIVNVNGDQPIEKVFEDIVKVLG